MQNLLWITSEQKRSKKRPRFGFVFQQKNASSSNRPFNGLCITPFSTFGRASVIYLIFCVCFYIFCNFIGCLLCLFIILLVIIAVRRFRCPPVRLFFVDKAMLSGLHLFYNRLTRRIMFFAMCKSEKARSLCGLG